MIALAELLALPTRSGATDAEVAAPLPGDELVPDATHSIDRCTTLPAPPHDVWPWLLQLGKGRGGWYFPRRVEAVLPYHGLHHLDPGYLHVVVGDEVADWGPGKPLFRAVVVDPDRSLVWHSLRDRANGHGWPVDPSSPDVLAFSWAFALSPVDEGTRLHIRLRLRAKRPVLAQLGGLFDWLTIALLFRGLRERVTA